MNALNRKVAVPKFLQELHGKQATIIDIVITYATAVLFTLLAIYLAKDISLPPYKFIILGFLTFDISGGVVANFTDGTQAYYNEKAKLRMAFIAMHVLQPALLVWLFYSEMIPVVVLSVFTIMAMLVLNGMKRYALKRLFASFFAVIGVTLTFTLPFAEPIVHLLMVLFLIKLVIAFSIQWGQDNVN